MARSSRALLTVALLALGVVAVQSAPAGATVPAGFSDDLVASVGAPTAMAFTPDGRMLVTTQGGAVRVIKNQTLMAAAALDLSSQVCSNSERGLLGVAVDPSFATNGYVFVYYSFKKTAACDTTTVNRVSRFVMTGDTLGGEVVLIDNIPSPAGNHNAGDVQFAKDGFLYVSVGDGGCDYPGGTPSGCGGSNDASRDQHALVGKILRIDRDGGIPPDNPFQGAGTARCNVAGVVAAGLKCQETFAWGLRNPFRMAFDPNAAGTRFYVNDVGQATWEEIDLGATGADYGWNVREGHCATGSTTDCGPPPAGMTNPIFDYGRSDGCATITGGAFVPTGLWPPEYQGKYLFADYLCGKIFRLDPNGGGGFDRVDFATGLGGGTAVHLRFGPFGSTQALYYTTYAEGGQIRRIARTEATIDGPAVSVSPTTAAPGAQVTASWSGLPNPAASDWLGLYAVGAPDTSYLAWRYTTGAAAGAVAFAIPAGTSPGSYELRLYTNGFNLRATGPLTVSGSGGSTTSSTTTTTVSTGGPAVSVSPTTAAPGAQVTASWSGLPNPAASDWLGLYAVGAPDTSYLAWRYTTGAAAGAVAFAIPAGTPPGSYELRLYTNGFNLRATGPLTVSGSGGSTTSSTTTTTVSTGGPAVSVSPTTAAPGAQVTASWSGLPNPAASDWLGLYAVGAPDTSYLAWRYTTGAAAGAVAFAIPAGTPPGSYEVRLYTNGFNLRATGPLTVSGSGGSTTSSTTTTTVSTGGPTVSVSPTTAAPGAQVTVSWSGLPNPAASDWLGLYAVGAPDTSYLAWRYTTGAAAGAVAFAIPPGTPPGSYEVRLYTNGFNRRATSSPLTIQAGP